VERRRYRIRIVSSAVDRNRQPGAAAPVRSRRPVLIFVGGLIGIVLT
jgi:hypothetical protein